MESSPQKFTPVRAPTNSHAWRVGIPIFRSHARIDTWFNGLSQNSTIEYDWLEQNKDTRLFANTPEGRMLRRKLEFHIDDVLTSHKRYFQSSLRYINRKDPQVPGFDFIAINVLGCDPKKLRSAIIDLIEVGNE